MLTTTYSITLLSSEQQKARRILGKLEHCLRLEASQDAGGTDAAWLEKVRAKLVAIDRFCHERKIELYLIPVLRKVAGEAGALLDRLASLRVDAMRILDYMNDRIRHMIEGGQADIALLVSVAGVYCRIVRERLALEDNELLPTAHRLLSNEDWFQVASRCLSHGTARSLGTSQETSGRVNRYRPRYMH
ncbi:hypothetical protein EGT07_01375 [Herbaspirillum sp. HC18]|nr:hypothetical protein EGT07_01375 [Herbaspirillum sp. HC18]